MNPCRRGIPLDLQFKNIFFRIKKWALKKKPKTYLGKKLFYNKLYKIRMRGKCLVEIFQYKKNMYLLNLLRNAIYVIVLLGCKKFINKRYILSNALFAYTV